MQIPFVDLKAQYQNIAPEINEAVSKVIGQTDFILGEAVGRFEQEFAAFCGTKYAIGVASGLDALQLALRVLDIGPGDEVITVANTFIATALAISAVSAKPMLVDIDPDTYNMDVTKLAQAISSHTKAILPVHLYGQPADMQPILEIARAHKLRVVEDACQSHGATYRGQPAGSLGDIGCFSFYPGKNLGAYGDGGAIVTNNPEMADKLNMLRNYGQKVKYYHLMKGVNSRLDTLQAAILRVKLKYLKGWNAARYEHAQYYNKLLSPLKVALPKESPLSTHIYHLYVIRLSNRDEVLKRLHQAKIFAGIHYPVPIHLQQAYADLGYRRGDFPVTESYADQILSLPMYPELTAEQIEYTCQTLAGIIQE